MVDVDVMESNRAQIQNCSRSESGGVIKVKAKFCDELKSALEQRPRSGKLLNEPATRIHKNNTTHILQSNTVYGCQHRLCSITLCKTQTHRQKKMQTDIVSLQLCFIAPWKTRRWGRRSNLEWRITQRHSGNEQVQAFKMTHTHARAHTHSCTCNQSYTRLCNLVSERDTSKITSTGWWWQQQQQLGNAAGL